VESGVADGTLRALDTKMSADWPLMYSKYLQARARDLELWQRVSDNALKSIRDRATHDAIRESRARVVESAKRVNEINQRLNDALAAEKAGSSTLAYLRIMRTVVSVAELASIARQEFGSRPASTASVPTSTIVKSAEQAQAVRHDTAVRLASDFDGSFSELQRAVGDLWRDLQPANPPPTLKNSFDIVKPARLP
jgi:hypothetical protein